MLSTKAFPVFAVGNQVQLSQQWDGQNRGFEGTVIEVNGDMARVNYFVPSSRDAPRRTVQSVIATFALTKI